MFKEIAEKFDQPFKSFRPFRNVRQREDWDNLDETVKKQIIEEAKNYSLYNYPTLLSSEFMRFKTDGNRIDYEAIYFKRRRALVTAVIAECIENKGKHLQEILNGIFALCEESAWQLPAHNSYNRDDETDLLPDALRPVLDLFACETGALLAMIDYLMGITLDEISPSIRRRIHHELDKRIIRPYLSKHFWWMGADQEPLNNWTVWCTQNILLTFFLTPQRENDRISAFQKASKAIDYFLDGYGDDGCCDEGPQYYRHAALCLFNSIEILEAITDGAFSSVYDAPKIKNLAAYIYYVHVSGDYYINFSDASAKPGRAGVGEYLFAKKTNQSKMMAYAANDFKQNKDALDPEQINLYNRLQTIFYYHEIQKFDSESINSSDSETTPDIFFSSVGLMVARDSNFTLAVKAGGNNDSHNHNDTGSFILYRDNHPVFVDVGVGSYNSKTFSNERYSLWTMQSDYHNLPTILGEMQEAGEDYKATAVKTELKKELIHIAMDLKNAYPKRLALKEAFRSVHFHKEHHIQIRDVFVFDRDENNKKTGTGDIILNFITYDRPILKDLHMTISDTKVDFEGDIDKILIETLPIDDARLKTSWDHDLYRTRVFLNGNSLTTTIS